MREIKKVIIHCSDSSFGNALLIDKWHRERGWKGIGYHFVILNGCIFKDNYMAENDGLVEVGRAISEIGAHCKGQNEDSIGICLIGERTFTPKQLYYSLPRLLKELNARFGIISGEIYGHYQFDPGKTCPNIDMRDLKDFVRIKFKEV